MARPTKLTPLRRDRIINALRAGAYRSLAARSAGVGDSTFHKWMGDPRPVYREFREAVELAEAEAEDFAVASVRHAMASSWRAAAWWLERRRPGWRVGRDASVSQDISNDGVADAWRRVIIIDPAVVAKVGIDLDHERPGAAARTLAD